jgi:hypothetical protein
MCKPRDKALRKSGGLLAVGSPTLAGAIEVRHCETYQTE